ncbi:MAG: ParB/RepB/Spo0J family partition protein [Acidobacteria bacterium]|nr:MAG: ParB/RepB/Spo0J family partition protein [Acidobacteriota bacterium]
MPKRGLPSGVGLKHDSHYVEELTRVSRAIGKTLPIDKIEPNPVQPRNDMGDLTELTESIKQKGVLEPILVFPNRGRGTWTIIAGERRWRAASMAGLKEIPCVELDLDEKEVAEIALIENLQRKDLTVWEEADGLAALARRFGYTHEEIAKRIGKSRTSVTESLSIANLPEQVRKRCIQLGINSKSTLLEVARQFDESQMMQFLDLYSQSSTQSRDSARKLARKSSEPSAKKNQTETFDNPMTRTKIAAFSHGEVLIEVFSFTKNPDAGLLISAVEMFLKSLRERNQM